MNWFFYDFVKVKYPGDRSTLLYTDTDSFLLLLKTNDVYQDMLEDWQFYDFSEFPRDAEIFQKLNMSEDEITELMEVNRKVGSKLSHPSPLSRSKLIFH